MGPADVEEHVSNLQSQGLGIVCQYTFKDLRGGQKGTGPEQTLLVPGSKEKSLDNLLLILKELTLNYPTIELRDQRANTPANFIGSPFS